MQKGMLVSVSIVNWSLQEFKRFDSQGYMIFPSSYFIPIPFDPGTVRGFFQVLHFKLLPMTFNPWIFLDMLL
jgi:hypothetical protein